MSVTRRMLVPTDFSPASEMAFRYALDMAAREGYSLHLLNVMDDAVFAAGYPDGFFVELPEMREDAILEATRRLNAMVDRCRASGVAATMAVAMGRPAHVIIDTAAARGTDLIVMGTHGRSGCAHLLLGSIAELVVRTAPCAVLTVRDTSRIADTLAAEAATSRFQAA